jgi:hypothetical protein
MSAFPSAGSNPFAQYTDSWAIPDDRTAEFAQRLAGLIFEQAKLTTFGDSILTKHSAATVRALSLKGRHQRVIYRDREIMVTPESQPSFDELVKVLEDVAFVKPKQYSPEQEYRFVFELTDGQTIFQPRPHA